MSELQHIPVMADEALRMLRVLPNRWYLDATFGRGGHTRRIIQDGGKVVAIDCDASAIAWGEQYFQDELRNGWVQFDVHNFDTLGNCEKVKGKKFDGILFDFGVNSAQLDEPERGFSFQKDAPLDMRLDRSLLVTARDLVNGLGRKEISQMLFSLVQERRAAKIAHAIVNARARKPIATTTELARIIESAVGSGRTHLHPATKTFLALRIAVNDELGSIERALPAALELLRPGGRIVAISFHESEDRIVKRFMKRWEKNGLGTHVTRKPLVPCGSEIQRNPRSRSAKLRVFEKKG